MSTFIEYELENEVTILIESKETEISGAIRVGRDANENVIIKANKKFRDALQDCKLQAKLFIQELEDLHVDEAEIRFGLTTTGEIGNLAIGKFGVDANYEVLLKWKPLNSIEKSR